MKWQDVSIYFDGIIIFLRGVKEHFEHINKKLQLLMTANAHQNRNGFFIVESETTLGNQLL